MDYRTVREAAEEWNLSPRKVQKLCIDGRIPGARKFGGAWAIPAGAANPEHAARPPAAEQQQSALGGLLDQANLMPLMNTPFPPGQCRQAVEAMPPGPRRDIALAEYHYFTGRPEEAARAAEAYLTSEDRAARLSACLIYAYANLPLGHIQRTRFALGELNASLTAAGEKAPAFRAAAAFLAAAGAVLLHLPLPKGVPEMQGFLPLLPPGLRAFALYISAHYRYLQGDYGPSVGLVEGALAMGAEGYPIPAIYLHLVAVMDYMSLKQTGKAKEHLLAAWALARPDDLIEALGEHHGLLGGMLEAVLKPQWPEDFKRIIDITYRFSAGWRKVHNPETGHDVADDLTTTEFAASMLAARGWTNQEIADHMGVSLNTVKSHLSEAMEKLGVTNRKDLKKYMLQ